MDEHRQAVEETARAFRSFFGFDLPPSGTGLTEQIEALCGRIGWEPRLEGGAGTGRLLLRRRGTGQPVFELTVVGEGQHRRPLIRAAAEGEAASGRLTGSERVAAERLIELTRLLFAGHLPHPLGSRRRRRSPVPGRAAKGSATGTRQWSARPG